MITIEAQGTIDPDDMLLCLQRHADGDPGDSPVPANVHRSALLSVFRDRNGTVFEIVTDPSEGSTTVQLPARNKRLGYVCS